MWCRCCYQVVMRLFEFWIDTKRQKWSNSKIVDGSLIIGYGIESSCQRIKHWNVICLVISPQLTYDDPSFWTWGFIHERPSWVSWARVLVLPVLELDLCSEHFRVIELCIGDGKVNPLEQMTHPTSPIVFLIVRVWPKNQNLGIFRKCDGSLITFPSLLPPLAGPSAWRPEFKRCNRC